MELDWIYMLCMYLCKLEKQNLKLHLFFKAIMFFSSVSLQCNLIM